MPDPLDQIVVLRGHLEQIFDAFDWALTYVKADVIKSAALDCMGETRETRLVSALTQSRDRVVGYLVVEHE